MATRADDTDVLGEDAVRRLLSDLRAALRRRPAQEAKLAGPLRALARLSRALSEELFAALETMVRRGSYDRPLYGAAVRALAESGERRAAPLVARALEAEDAGGLVTLSAACFTSDGALREPLARAAVSRHPVVAFGAEVARLARGESNGSRILSLAPKIKESHRIALCTELFVPLLGRAPLAPSISPALGVLRDAERHLGRWLVMAEVATRAGDQAPLVEARSRATAGAASARAAWTLVAWALDPSSPAPTTRPTVELVSRLSDRPSADRDATFLFRMAAAKAPSARPMLEGIAKGGALGEDAQIRAALHLCRDYGDDRQAESFAEAGKSPRQDGLRALAAAACWDCGRKDQALELAQQLDGSRSLAALGWRTLVRAGQAGAVRGALVTEVNYRRIHQGWVE